MKEHPIIFTHNIGKILDGRKTQTRRVIKPQPIPFHPKNYPWKTWYDLGSSKPSIRGCMDMETLITKCPYGQVGDRLWVRETWVEDRLPNFPEIPHGVIHYKADNIPVITESWKGYWKSPLFMPRWASRITLEITNIRVERLQEITEEDAEAEGITPLLMESWRKPNTTVTQSTAVEEFSRLWNSLNAKYPWESNPWVWVIEFKRIAGNA